MDSPTTPWSLRRLFWFCLGGTAMLLGLIGVALPVLPTTPFMILAVFAFGKSSPRLARWLEDHRLFGPPIRDWQAHGAIRPRHKRMALIMMAAVFGLSLIMALPLHLLAIQALCLGGAGLFILTRPNGPAT